MKIKQLSQETGLTQKTIRYYEAQGLISPQWETKNGKRFRDYTDLDLDDLTHVAALRRAMFTVEEIRSMQDDPDQIPQLLNQYRLRMEQLAVETALLAKASRSLGPEDCGDFKALADGLEAAARTELAPKHSVEPHFGRFDPETISQEELRRLKQAQNNAYSAMVFYNLTSVAQRVPMGREELANIYPTPTQRVGILNAMRDDWDSAWETVSETPASAESRQRRRNKYLIAALIGLAVMVFLAVMTIAVWSKKPPGQEEASIPYLRYLVISLDAAPDDTDTDLDRPFWKALSRAGAGYPTLQGSSFRYPRPDEEFSNPGFLEFGRDLATHGRYDLLVLPQAFYQAVFGQDMADYLEQVFTVTDRSLAQKLSEGTWYLCVPYQFDITRLSAERHANAILVASALGEPADLDELADLN